MNFRLHGVSMRVTIACGVALILLSGCGQPTVADRIDLLIGSGESYRHNSLPSPARKAVLDTKGMLTVLPNESSLGDRLREDENGRAVLDSGETAVPELISLLDDQDRRILAAVLLAEIGGEEAATALLKRWRDLRDDRLKKHTYIHLADPEGPDSPRLAGGYHYEGVEGNFYGEILFALSYCGLPVSGAIAVDTRDTMDESERLQAEGAELSGEENFEATDVYPNGATESWSIGPVETGDEGLRILVMIGAPEASGLFVRALGSPVRSFQYTAVQSASYLGDAVGSVLPALGSLLDDPDLRRLAVQELAVIIGGTHPSASITDDELDVLVETARAKLHKLGHLPR